MKSGRSSWVKRAAGIVLAAFAVLVPPGFGGNQGIGQDIRFYKRDTPEMLEAKASGLIIGKTAKEIMQALEPGLYDGISIVELHGAALDDGVEVRPGDLHVIFTFPKERVFEPLTPRLSILVGMQDGVAVSIKWVRTYAK